MTRMFHLDAGEAASARLIPLAIACALWVGAMTAARADVDDNRLGSERLHLNPLNALKRSDLKAFKEKPLFTPSRQAPPAPARRADPVPATAAPVQLEEPKVLLTGVIEGTMAPVAILQHAGSSAATPVRVGDHVDGWLVATIDSLSVLLKDGSRIREYRLFDPNSPPAQNVEAAPSRPTYNANPKVDLGANIRSIMQKSKTAVMESARPR